MINKQLLEYYDIVINNKLSDYKNPNITMTTEIISKVNEKMKDIYMQSYQYNELISAIRINSSTLSDETVTKLEVTMLESLQMASKSLNKYINKVSKLKTEKDVVSAINRYKKKRNTKDFDEIIRKYSKQMSKAIWSNKSKLSKYDTDISFDEVFHIMIENVERAIMTFDESMNVKFTTHLNPWIYEVIRNPSKYIGKLRGKIKQKNISIKKSGNKIKGAIGGISSGDTIIGGADGSSTTPFDNLANGDIDMEQDYIDTQKMKVMYKLIGNLSDTEQKIINLKFGFSDNDKFKNQYGNVTNTLIAKELGVSIPTVNNILVRVLKKLKNKLKN